MAIRWVSKASTSTKGYTLAHTHTNTVAKTKLQSQENTLANRYRSSYGDSVTISKEARNKSNNIKSALSTTADLIPGVSNVKSGIEAITGRDPITGNKLTKTERVIAASGIILPGSVKTATKTVNIGGKAVSKGTDKSIKQGEFSITNWNGYPKNGKKPDGPFRLLEGEEYKDARREANNANAALHRKNPSLKGKQIHEIHPVKFGGSPTDNNNKVPLSPKEHAEYTRYWNNLMRNIKK